MPSAALESYPSIRTCRACLHITALSWNPPAEQLRSEDLSGRGPGAPPPCSAPILVRQLDAESWVWMELQEQLPRLAR